MTPVNPSDSKLDSLRSAVADQLGDWTTGVVRARTLESSLVVKWRHDLPQDDEVLSKVASLQPWLQGPFPLPGGLEIAGPWRTDLRWDHLAPHLPDIAGKTVLDIGSNAGYDAFRFSALGASHVVACEPYKFIEQAKFLNTLYDTNVEFSEKRWQDLDPDSMGRFDIVHCHGVLYHEPHPQALLDRIRLMLSPNGCAIVGSILHNEPTRSDSIRFLPRGYFNDPTWWFLPGRLAFRWMLEAAGLQSTIELNPTAGAPGEFETIDQYHICDPITPRSQG
jgi:tRNA (mo5U34)-methyltransferase